MPPVAGRAPRAPGSALRLLVVLLAVVGWLGAAPVAAQAPDPDDPTVTTAPVPEPTASIVVDVDSGEVVTAVNARQALPPASTTKILTVLLAQVRLGLDAEITISNTAAIAPPRRIGLPPGTRWGVEGLAYASMHCSCNDAAWALGQAAGGGSMAGFEAQAAVLGAELGLADAPVIRDPAGLDDERSVRGGNLISARDLAIISRAYLADPELAAIAVAPGHEWDGGDGEPHTVTNLNRFLGRYEGAIGLKTGSTDRAGLTFAAVAERDGRRLVAVVLGSRAHYAHARALLDAGFLLAAAGQVTGDRLPPVPAALGEPEPTTTTSTTTSTTAPATVAEPSAAGETPEVAAPRLEAGDLDTPGESGREPLILVAGGAGAALVAVGVAWGARRRQTRGGRIDRRLAPRRRRRRA